MSKDTTASTLGAETPDTKAQEAAKEQETKTAKAAVGKEALDKGLQAQGFSGKRETITLAAARDENEQDFVFVSINSVGFQIPRGKPVSVPVEVLNVLDDAVQTVYDKAGQPRQVPRHAYQVAR